MDIRPDFANVERNGKIEKVNPDDVKIGEIIVIKPGEKIPLDGCIIEGSSSLDTKALTGESLPKDVSENEEVLSGCINLSGVIKVKVTKFSIRSNNERCQNRSNKRIWRINSKQNIRFS